MGAESEADYLNKIKAEHEAGKSGIDRNMPIWGPLKENIDLMGDKDLRKAHSTGEIIANQGALVGETALVAGAIYGGAMAISGLGKGAMVGGAFGKGSAGYAGVNGLLPEAKLLSTGNILSKGLKLAGSTGGKLALTAIGADQLTNWFASDNVITGASVNIGKLYSQMGSASPEQRAQLIESAEHQKHIADLAKAKIVISGIVDPTNWIMGEAFWVGSEVPMAQMQTYLDAMRNYNPMMDDFSQESKQLKEKKNLQTYGNPKYDEQGNPLNYY